MGLAERRGTVFSQGAHGRQYGVTRQRTARYAEAIPFVGMSGASAGVRQSGLTIVPPRLTVTCPRQSLISINAAWSRPAHCLPRSTRSEKALGMPGLQTLLFVIADGEHMRFVRPAEDNALHSDAAVASFAAHKRSSDLGSDPPGASYHTGSSAHHSLAPRHDSHMLEKEKFARFVAERLNAAGAAKAFDELVIVAPPHIVSVIRQGLDTATDAKVVGMLAKDLVKTPDSELWPHVRHWVRPVHRATL